MSINIIAKGFSFCIFDNESRIYQKERKNHHNPSPSTISYWLQCGLYKIRKYYKNIELNDFSRVVAVDDNEIRTINDLNKSIEILNFIKWNKIK